MRQCIAIVLALGIPGASYAQNSPTANEKRFVSFLQGEWTLSGFEYVGQKVPNDIFPEIQPKGTLVVSGQKFRLVTFDKENSGILQIRESKGFFEMDFVVEKGILEGRKLPLLGKEKDGVLHMAADRRLKLRPADFKIADSFGVHTYKRVLPKK